MNSCQNEDLDFRVMVVDDSKLSRRVLIQALKEFKEVQCKDFENPVSALGEIDEFKPDLIISDREMPNMDGIEFCRQIRGHEEFNETPFIMISSCIDMSFKSKVLDLGVSDALPKGFKSKDLSKIVERFIREKKGGDRYAVLIVDDSLLNRSLLKKLMKDMKFTVLEAGSPIEAQEQLEEHPVDLILLDNDMPDKYGVTWCEELRQSKEFKNVCIVGVSASHEMSLTFLKSGADDFIQKPIIKEELLVKITQHLRRIDLERELKAHVEREKTLNHQKNVLLGTAAHDIRNPIASIISYLSLISDMEYEDEDTNFVISNCYNLAEKALDLLNDILDTSNIDAGSIKLDLKEYDLIKIIENRIEELNILSKKKNIQIRACIGVHESAVVNVDVKRLSQVMDNLLSNAVKYSHPNTYVKVELSKEIDGWLVQVVDQGQGIPEHELDGIFSEFSKTSVQTTAGESSTGLGLAIVKKIIDAHDGTIWVESEVGTGSKFIFKLPL